MIVKIVRGIKWLIEAKDNSVTLQNAPIKKGELTIKACFPLDSTFTDTPSEAVKNIGGTVTNMINNYLSLFGNDTLSIEEQMAIRKDLQFELLAAFYDQAMA